MNNMNPSDSDLLNKARSFDADALTQIYDTYSPGIYRYAMRLLGDECMAEECVSDTFSRFLGALRSGGGPQDQLKAYLYRVAHNWITDTYRRTPPPPLALQEDVRSNQTPPDTAAFDAITQAQVRAALVRLTGDQRQVIVLKFLEGWENEAIAATLNKPVGAVKALQHRAVQALRKMLLSEEGNEYDDHANAG